MSASRETQGNVNNYCHIVSNQLKCKCRRYKDLRRTRRQLASPLLARPTGVWQTPSAVSCLVAGGTSCCRCGAFVSSLSEHASPEQSGGVPLAGLGPRIDLQAMVRSGSSFAARVGRRISVLTRGSKGSAVLPSTPIV